MMICCAAAWLLAACSKDDDLPGGQTGGNGNSIILDISSGALPVSRATVPAEGAEVAVSHIDVLIFNDTDEKTKVWSDRVNASANETGRITLPVKRSSFTENERYWVYLIANSTHPEKDFENLANLNALKAMTQEDENIHLTGKDIEGVPGTFLMDGIAYPEGNDEPAVAAPVVLYDGSQGNDTRLAVTLRRAAAKVVVTINKGQDVTFDSKGIGYYLRNMPYTTSVASGAIPADIPEKVTPLEWTYQPDQRVDIGIDVTSFAGFDNKSVDPFGQAFEIYIDAPMLKIDAGRLAENRLDGTKLKAHPTIPGRFVYTVDAKRETERRYGTDDIANTDNIASSQRGERKTLPFLVNSVVSAGDIVISSDESRVVYYSKTFRVSNQSIAGTLQYKNTAGVVQTYRRMLSYPSSVPATEAVSGR